jgi:hypothetical protein
VGIRRHANILTRIGSVSVRRTARTEVERVHIADIEPPTRSNGIAPFRKYKLLPILFAFQSPECILPPVTVVRLALNASHRFRVLNGFHRFFASVAVGYTLLPVVIQEGSDE